MTGHLALHVCDLRQPSMQAAMRDVQNGDQAPTGSSYALHVAPTQKKLSSYKRLWRMNNHSIRTYTLK